MIDRDLTPALLERAAAYPVVTVTGPRQAGKTTLCRATFPDHAYVNLEEPAARAEALGDPGGFLASFRGAGVIIDEVQRAPELTSWLLARVDEDPTPGRYILTGSAHFGVMEQVSQSLAGRTGILHLLPPSLGELRRFPSAPDGLWETLVTGAWPRLHDRGIPPRMWFEDYVATYVERDVRAVLQVGSLTTFNTFMRLCAGRTAQELNLSTLGADAGITQPTARAWLSVLEASWLVHRLPPWHTNVRKRLVKAPKIHFVDSGLACHLLGIHDPDQLRHHPLRGPIFESWVASEVLKAWVHRGRAPRLHHYREASGTEVDLVVDLWPDPIFIEAKSGSTLADDAWTSLERAASVSATARQVLVYGGDRPSRRRNTVAIPWTDMPGEDWGAG